MVNYDCSTSTSSTYITYTVSGTSSGWLWITVGDVSDSKPAKSPLELMKEKFASLRKEHYPELDFEDEVDVEIAFDIEAMPPKASKFARQDAAFGLLSDRFFEKQLN